MKISLRKRIIAFMLSVILLFSGSISGFASELLESDPMAEAAAAVVSEEATEPATEAATEATETSAAIISEEITEATEAVTEEVTEPATEAVTEEATEAAAKEETVEETEEEIVEETETETVEETEESEEETEETEEEKDINLQTTVNGTVIKMTGPSSSFPEGTDYSISATELTSAQENDVEAALRKMELESETKVVSYQAFDIKLIVDGVEAQPLGEVKVTFEGGAVEEKIESTENENVEVFHINEVAQEAQPITNEVNNNTVEMTTDHFSTYVITITTNKKITVTVEHYLDAEGSEEENRLFRTKQHELDFLSKLAEIAVETDHYEVSKIVKVTKDENDQPQRETLYTATNTNSKIDINEVLDGSATYKVYYQKTKGTESGDIQMFDYLVSTSKGSINDTKNYAVQGNGIRFTIGSHRYTVDDVTLNGQKVNKWTGSSNVVKKIITGVNYATGALEMNSGNKGQMYEPGLFTSNSNDPTIGKVILDGYSLEFSREGDSYTLKYVKKNGDNVAEAGNQFFPLDRYDRTPVIEGVSATEAIEEVETATGISHNYYFGMRYNIAFTIGDYVGPLNYYFSGDDDLWVVLDAKDGGGKVVVDLGGIHLAASDTVDLWDYLDPSPVWNAELNRNVSDMHTKPREELTEAEIAALNKEHTLTVLYLERGADQSNCNMEFTLPNSKIVGPTVNEVTFGLTLQKRVEGLTHAELETLKDDLTFEITAVKDKESTAQIVPFEGRKIKASELTWACGPETCEDGVHTGTYTLTTQDTSVLAYEYIITESDELVDGYDVTSQVSTGGMVAQGVTSPKILFSASSINNTVVFTNKYTPNTKDIEVTKIWSDAENIYGKRPAEIKFNLQWKYQDDSTWNNYDLDKDGNADEFVMNTSHVDSENTNVWKCTVSGLPISDEQGTFEYRVVESTDVSQDGYVASMQGNTTMVNTLASYIVKRGLDGTQKPVLEGAIFKATSKTPSGIVYYGESDANGIVKWYRTYDSTNGVSVPVASTEIENGTYELEEKVAPVGYMVSRETWDVTFKDGVITVTGKGDEDSSTNTVEIFFDNIPLYELPSTGSMGIYWYMIAGTMMMMMATAITYKNRREEVLERVDK